MKPKDAGMTRESTQLTWLEGAEQGLEPRCPRSPGLTRPTCPHRRSPLSLLFFREQSEITTFFDSAVFLVTIGLQMTTS